MIPTPLGCREMACKFCELLVEVSHVLEGGNHGFLPLVLSKDNMRPAAGSNNLDYERLKKPELINPIIEDITLGLELLQFQADQKV